MRDYAGHVGRAGAAFTLLTTEPDPDVVPIHDRLMVILKATTMLALRDVCAG